MPPQRPGIDHAIDTEPGQIPKPKVYGLTRKETEAVKAYTDEMLGKSFIKPSTSPYDAPVLVVKKPGGGLRICVDYRALNNITKKNRNAPPAIKETFARLAKVKVMTLVDVVAAFNTVRVKEGDTEKQPSSPATACTSTSSCPLASVTLQGRFRRSSTRP